MAFKRVRPPFTLAAGATVLALLFWFAVIVLIRENAPGLIEHLKGWKPEKPETVIVTFITVIATLASALLAGGITLGVSLWNNRQMRILQETNLRYQADEKERERRHAMKREAYLALSDFLIKCWFDFCEIVKQPLGQVKPEDATVALQQQVFRASLIAPPAVLSAVNTVQHQMVEALLTFIPARMKIDEVAAKVNALQMEINEGWENLHIMGLQGEEPGPKTAREVETLKTRNATEKARVEDIGREQRKLLQEQTARESEAHKLILKLSDPLSESMPRVLSAMREDLGIPPEAEWMSAFIKYNREKLVPRIAAFQDEMNNRITQRQNSQQDT